MVNRPRTVMKRSFNGSKGTDTGIIRLPCFHVEVGAINRPRELPPLFAVPSANYGVGCCGTVFGTRCRFGG